MVPRIVPEPERLLGRFRARAQSPSPCPVARSTPAMGESADVYKLARGSKDDTERITVKHRETETRHVANWRSVRYCRDLRKLVGDRRFEAHGRLRRTIVVPAQRLAAYSAPASSPMRISAIVPGLQARTSAFAHFRPGADLRFAGVDSRRPSSRFRQPFRIERKLAMRADAGQQRLRPNEVDRSPATPAPIATTRPFGHSSKNSTMDRRGILPRLEVDPQPLCRSRQRVEIDVERMHRRVAGDILEVRAHVHAVSSRLPRLGRREGPALLVLADRDRCRRSSRPFASVTVRPVCSER